MQLAVVTDGDVAMYWASEGLRLPGSTECRLEPQVPSQWVVRLMVGQQTPNLLMVVRFPHGPQTRQRPPGGTSPYVGCAPEREGKLAWLELLDTWQVHSS